MSNIQIKANLDSILLDLDVTIEKISDVKSLHALKSQYLGKNSVITSLLKSLNTYDNETKITVGKLVNEAKVEVTTKINNKIFLLEKDLINQQLKLAKIDLTVPGISLQTGFRNPLFLVIDEITNFFHNLGYKIISGNEVENEEYNFNRLNLPKNHPARTMQDTFYLTNNANEKNKWLLRTHATNMTARILSEKKSEITESLAFISLGNVYRKDDDDATHSHQFMQIDAFLIGKDVTFANLKWTLQAFCQHLFGKETQIRLRPSYFPFTEPSAEVDVSCPLCHTKGCYLCKHSGWIEILGSGMIHPNVFAACGINSNELRGFAFGIGIERIAMIKYSIDDIRLFYNNDLRFLRQF